MNDRKVVVICPEGHRTTPLIWTFAFRGTEWWCPFCGYRTGAFGRTREMTWAPELQALLDAYRERAVPFLDYQASLGGATTVDESGKHVPFEAPKAGYEYQVPIDVSEAVAQAAQESNEEAKPT